MKNIFETIIGGLPAPKQEDVDKLNKLEQENNAQAAVGKPSDFSKLPLKDMVLTWQKNQSPENTQILLKRFAPTIKSAINSYAQGMEDSLAIKAAGLTLNALKTYRPDSGAEPTTYVFHGLKRLNRLSADRNAIIHYPEQQAADAYKVKKFMTEFEDDKGREPSMGEIADALGMPTKKIDKLLSLPAVVNDSTMISDDTGDALLGKKDLTDSDFFEYVYSSVSPIDQKIMEWTSGYHKKPILSNNAIAEKLHISPAAVSQRKAKINSMMSDVRGLL